MTNPQEPLPAAGETDEVETGEVGTDDAETGEVGTESDEVGTDPAPVETDEAETEAAAVQTDTFQPDSTETADIETADVSAASASHETPSYSPPPASDLPPFGGTPQPGSTPPFDAPPHDAPPHDAPPASGPYSGASAQSPRTASATADRFFSWLSGLGIARSEGWLGGVAAGLAARLRIDPLIVRGVLVVAALFGLPVIFLYALAWALLPDTDGRIHARDLFRGDYQPVQWGILATAVVGLVPTAPLTGAVFGLGYGAWSAFSVFTWITALAIVGILIFLIVRAASRTPGASASDLPMASAGRTAPDAPVTLGDSGSPEGAGAPWSDASATSATSPSSATAATYAPPVPAASAAAAWPDPTAPVRPEPPAAPAANDPEALAAWRAQHAAWKEQDQAWRRQQQDAERAVRDQLRRERQAEAAVFATEAAERRRIRRASNPRASFAYVASVGGLAIVTGAGVALWGGLGEAAGAIGVLSAALVLAIGMIVAGAWRRRSGFLAFLTAATLSVGLISGAALSMPQTSFGWVNITNDRPTTLVQPFGELYVSLSAVREDPGVITVDKGAGGTWITVEPGVALDLRATMGSGSVYWNRTSTDGEFLDDGWTSGTAVDDGRFYLFADTFAAEDGTTSLVQRVTITQRTGDITVTIQEPSEEDAR